MTSRKVFRIFRGGAFTEDDNRTFWTKSHKFGCILFNKTIVMVYDRGEQGLELAMLYYGIGKYIALNSREGFWGEGAIDTISERLQKELPGLRGFSARNLRYMRTFYEEWSILDSNSATDCDTKNYNLALVNAKTSGVSESAIWHLQVPNSNDFPADAFFEIGFTQHRMIFEKIKDRNAVHIARQIIICLDKALNHYFLRTALKMMRMAAKSTPATGQRIHALETPVKFMIKNAAVATSQ